MTKYVPHPQLLPDFVFREPDDPGDVRLLKGVEEHGWYVIGVPDGAARRGFSYTIGVHLRTLRPEILIMGLPVGNAPSTSELLLKHPPPQRRRARADTPQGAYVSFVSSP